MFILVLLARMLLPPGPFSMPPESGVAYLWLCGPPLWGTSLLPTISASGSPGGCSLATGEWPGRTHRETQSLQHQEVHGKAPPRPAFLPTTMPCQCAQLQKLFCEWFGRDFSPRKPLKPAASLLGPSTGTVNYFMSLADGNFACPRPT